ncbi:ferredoxin [Clostridium acetobutylicum]|uniref:Ferredoxin n=1 Tax=Clostridium acetobutylicum (strain ATCC 824 / DSM 792 / JCM 1419 / IAM 19013 / LMG 5710 / NBRC 13948 / NRRL B-527 / VKM B-1787 / 2291 / W) TaxID=272562 RepID=Q97D59_CLOAB|nr:MULTISPECIES: ferredoxin [Clostridium]AAK81544.1 Ferredoxin [Clostridium acetobutylicum ATCC 824]ADZ22665.1 Ferredoxin [Clostridium acetobutylicum EA 2018]AEI32962.1 ferredoxin [Clostridium acetobutylicum DSM 1731]AWV80783.1 ferredoxin [Clostridium acetobutylicum]KHD35507.1 ferredoxin [Clostridium acetobutylicum]
MKAFVDKETCIGCGTCPAICPEIFEMEDDGKAVASDAEIANDLKESAQDAAESCPVDAIMVR